MGAADFQQQVFAYRRSAEQDAPPHGARGPRHPVVVVGAGPVGLALAIDLAQQGVAVVLLDNDDRLSNGSRAICFSKRTLEIFDRLGCGQRMVDKGVSWSVGRVFFGDGQLYRFDLLPEAGHGRPAFINLQQYYVEGFLAERAAELPLIALRWKNTVVGLEQRDDPDGAHVRLTVDTPDGPYTLEAAHVVACDGSRSTLRRLLGQESHGQVFRDRFLIADVKMAVDFPAERWFWFDPPFHRGQSLKDGGYGPSSVLLHKQPDGVWRIDFQLGWDADPEAEKAPERILPRVQALLAHTAMSGAAFTLEWASVYTFACQRMDAFRHGRVVFAGDSAHGVSPFGARGANSGVQDAENLAWKLAAVLQGRADEALLASYGPEREYAADENILNSTRATDFITPKTAVSRMFRDATLALARQHPFARTLVNSGRLSVPAVLHGSPLNTADSTDTTPGFGPGGLAVPGATLPDAPITRDGAPGWLLQQTRSGRFTALLFDGPDNAAAAGALRAAADGLAPLDVLLLAPPGSGARLDGSTTLIDSQGLAALRCGAPPGAALLLRPDQHVCARWTAPATADVRAALRSALALA